MSKKSRFRGTFDKWDGKWGERALKSERQHFYHIYWPLWRTVELKKCLWVICKVWGLFLNSLTANYKYSLLNRGNLLQDFQMHLSQKRKIFCQFFFYFLNLESTLNIFKKKVTHNRGNLLQHFQMHLYQKRKIFCGFFFTFSKFRVNFEDFQEKGDPDSRCIFEFKDSEIGR